MVVCTSLFVPTAKTQAAISGIPSYKFAVIDHPIGRLGEEELKERAKVAADQVIKLLIKKERF